MTNSSNTLLLRLGNGDLVDFGIHSMATLLPPEMIQAFLDCTPAGYELALPSCHDEYHLNQIINDFIDHNRGTSLLEYSKILWNVSEFIARRREEKMSTKVDVDDQQRLTDKQVRLSSLYDALEVGLSSEHANNTILNIFAGMKRDKFTDDILDTIVQLKPYLDKNQIGLAIVCEKIRNLQNSAE